MAARGRTCRGRRRASAGRFCAVKNLTSSHGERCAPRSPEGTRSAPDPRAPTRCHAAAPAPHNQIGAVATNRERSDTTTPPGSSTVTANNVGALIDTFG